MRKLVVLCTLLLAIGGVANATWVSGNVGVWGDVANWTEGAVPGIPASTSTATINNGTCTLDVNPQVGILLLANSASTDVAVLNIDSDVTLIASKASTELIGLARVSGASGTINQSAGTVKVYRSDAAVTGELRLTNTAGAMGTYNLMGGLLDVQVLSKGGADRLGYFNATGGTLIVRNMIYRFGLNSAGYGFNQGQCNLEIGGIGTVGTMAVGNSTNATDYAVGAGGTLTFDIASASSFDIVTQIGSACNIEGSTLAINLLDGFVPTADSFFDVWTFSDKTKSGSGSFGVLPVGWSSAWVDTDGAGGLDTLRLTYVPEPATMLMLGLGALLSLKRRHN